MWSQVMKIGGYFADVNDGKDRPSGICMQAARRISPRIDGEGLGFGACFLLRWMVEEPPAHEEGWKAVAFEAADPVKLELEPEHCESEWMTDSTWFDPAGTGYGVLTPWVNKRLTALFGLPEAGKTCVVYVKIEV